MGFALSELELTTSAFENGGAIPRQHTGEGVDVSPALAWQKLPEGTQSIALFCHDPDAPLVTPRGDYGFVHWVLYNMPASINALDEGATGYTQGKNSFGNMGYNGPMPPPGHGRHQYYFWLLALDIETTLPEGLELPTLLETVEPNIIGMNRVIGSYERD